MEISEFYNILEKSVAFPPSNSFSFYLHGGIIDHPESTQDIDLKIVPRGWGYISIKTVEEVMKYLSSLSRIEAVMMRSINSFTPKIKPDSEAIDQFDIPILQALYNVDLRVIMKENNALNAKFIFKGLENFHSKKGEEVILKSYSGKTEEDPDFRVFWEVETLTGNIKRIRDSQMKYSADPVYKDNRNLLIGDRVELIEYPNLIKYKKIGNLLFYMSGEWAVMGRKLGNSNVGRVNFQPVEIRRVLVSPFSNWEDFKEYFQITYA